MTHCRLRQFAVARDSRPRPWLREGVGASRQREGPLLKLAAHLDYPSANTASGKRDSQKFSTDRCEVLTLHPIAWPVGGHMRRREFLELGVFGAAAGSTLFGRGSSAQSVRKRPLIAWAGAAPPGAKLPQFIVDLVFGNFIKGLSDFGYEQGRNIDIIRRTDILRDRVPSIEEMVALLKPDIIVAPATLEAVAARKATSIIPIVCPALADAVHLGLIASEARPGGNVTGIEPYIAGLPTKQIDLAREIVPKARRVGLLGNMKDPKVRLKSGT